MKRLEPEQIGDVLRKTLQQSGMTEKLYEAKAIAAWRSVIGDMIADRCGKPFIYAGLMTIYVASAPLRHELNMNRSALARAINDMIGRDTVADLRFR